MDRKRLNDDTLKLVRFKILFVKRDCEHVFTEHEELLADNVDESAFTAWKVAEFIEGLARGETPAPQEWGEKYPTNDEDRKRYVKDGRLVGVPEEDRQYLRVYYEVLERYPRELTYDEEKIEALRRVRARMGKGTAGK